MSHFSSVDLQSRLEVQDLLSRFCHALDHNRLDAWARLFISSGKITAPRLGCFVGQEELLRVPQMVYELGGGAWRHTLNNIYMDRIEGSRDIRVEAYCMVSDWRKSGNVVRCWDFSVVVGKRNGWKIVELTMAPVTNCHEKLSVPTDDVVSA